jgi:hypothetical protein
MQPVPAWPDLAALYLVGIVVAQERLIAAPMNTTRESPVDCSQVG